MEFTVIGEEEIADILQVTVLPCELRQKLHKGTVRATTRTDEIQEAQRTDPVLGRIWHYIDRGRDATHGERRKEPPAVAKLLLQWNRLHICSGRLCRTMTDPMSGEKVNQLLLPSSTRKEVLEELHDRMGHQGIDRVEKLVRARFYWPNLRSDIHNWIAKCGRCNLAKMPHFKVRTPMHSIVAKEPLEIVAIDFTILEPASNGIENVLVMTDVYSKFTITVPTRNQTAQTVAKALVREWFLRYGVPFRIHSDQGRCFDAKIVTELYKMLANQKATYDKRTREDTLQIGDHVHLRNRVKGRNKIGDAWDPTVYVVSEQMEDTYVVVPERGHKKRVINRKDLRVCVPETVNRQSRLGHESEVTVPLYEVTITSHPNNCEAVNPPAPPLRRSTRRNAGYHSNPHREPRSVLDN